MTSLSCGEYSAILEDFGAIEEFSVGPAEIEINEVKIPGRTGHLDMSEALTGETVYKEREVKLKLSFASADLREFNRKLTELSNNYHGRVCKLTLPDDEGFYYEGRVEIEGERIDPKKAEIEIGMKAYPFKKKVTETRVNQYIYGSSYVNLNNERESVVPEVSVDSEMTIEFQGKSKTIQAGRHLLDFVLRQGSNSLYVTGYGNITISYREGAL